VSEGVKLVNETGEGLTAIEQLVQHVNTHMDAIATAAQEQSVGLGEVNTAVNHMDQATQKNAAMVEEMNAAGAGLAQESSNLEHADRRVPARWPHPAAARYVRTPDAGTVRAGAIAFTAPARAPRAAPPSTLMFWPVM
jgi:methyl-accepting chemotaxis protein